MITDADPWRHPPRISLAGCERILKGGNPAILAEQPASAYYNYATDKGVDILYLLAQFRHESSLGTAGVATTTHSWGNTRTPNFGAIPVDTVHGASGTFPVWANWLDGLISTVSRYITPDWCYHDRKSIREIFDYPPDPLLVWAPAGDSNDPHGYLRAVIDFMNANADMTQGEVPGFEPHFDTVEFGYPQGTHGRNGVTIDRLIIHTTDGTDSLDWLQGEHGSSVHFLTWPNGTPRAQILHVADAAWGAGNKDYNLRAVQIEFEATAQKKEHGPWTDDEITNLATGCAAILRLPACANITIDRTHIIGHGDVSPQHEDPPHTDPGGYFPWPHFLERLDTIFHMDSNQQPSGGDPVTGKYIHPTFQNFYANNGGIDIFGRPVSGGFNEDGRLVQYFERNVFQSFPENNEPYRILLRLLGTDELHRRYPTGAPA